MRGRRHQHELLRATQLHVEVIADVIVHVGGHVGSLHPKHLPSKRLFQRLPFNRPGKYMETCMIATKMCLVTPSFVRIGRRIICTFVHGHSIPGYTAMGPQYDTLRATEHHRAQIEHGKLQKNVYLFTANGLWSSGCNVLTDRG